MIACCKSMKKSFRLPISFYPMWQHFFSDRRGLFVADSAPFTCVKYLHRLLLLIMMFKPTWEIYRRCISRCFPKKKKKHHLREYLLEERCPFLLYGSWTCFTVGFPFICHASVVCSDKMSHILWVYIYICMFFNSWSTFMTNAPLWLMPHWKCWSSRSKLCVYVYKPRWWIKMHWFDMWPFS